jgi:hypothetical protein
MFKNQDDYQLRYIYHTNRHNNAFLIELNLDQYDDLFNSWDGSVLDRKELKDKKRRYFRYLNSDIIFKYRD